MHAYGGSRQIAYSQRDIDRRAFSAHTLAMPSKKKPTAETPKLATGDFEAALNELEQLLQNLEKGDLSLEQSLSAYERGIGLFRTCQQALEQAQLRVKTLSENGDINARLKTDVD